MALTDHMHIVQHQQVSLQSCRILCTSNTYPARQQQLFALRFFSASRQPDWSPEQRNCACAIESDANLSTSLRTNRLASLGDSAVQGDLCHTELKIMSAKCMSEVLGRCERDQGLRTESWYLHDSLWGQGLPTV